MSSPSRMLLVAQVLSFALLAPSCANPSSNKSGAAQTGSASIAGTSTQSTATRTDVSTSTGVTTGTNVTTSTPVSTSTGVTTSPTILGNSTITRWMQLMQLSGFGFNFIYDHTKSAFLPTAMSVNMSMLVNLFNLFSKKSLSASLQGMPRNDQSKVVNNIRSLTNLYAASSHSNVETGWSKIGLAEQGLLTEFFSQHKDVADPMGFLPEGPAKSFLNDVRAKALSEKN